MIPYLRKFIHKSAILLAIFLISGGVAAKRHYLPNKIDESSILAQTLSYGLPVVEIITVDGEEPTAEPSFPPPGSVGQSITNATKVPGSITVYSPEGDTIYSSGDYVKKESGMTVKIRGNTSARWDKKPFKIKLQKKGDMLGRGDKRFNDKNWVLISNYDFKTYIGKHIGLLTGQPWMPEGTFVNLVFNGDYRGLYVLQESIERNDDCRVQVADDGFIVEHDPYWWNEDGQYVLSKDDPGYNYTFKYPEFEDISQETMVNISESLRKYEDSIDEGSYPGYIDVLSFAQWILAHDILGTNDGAGVNLYLVKESLSDDSKIKCGPLWDFESSELKESDFSSVHYLRFNKLFQNKNSTFLKEYINHWNNIKEDLQIKLDSIIADLKDPNWDSYNLSYNQDCIRWNKEQKADASHNDSERLKNWYDDRFSWLNKSISDLENDINSNGSESIIEPSSDISINNRVIIANKDLDNIVISQPDGRIFFFGKLSHRDSIILPSGIYIIKTPTTLYKIAFRT